MNDTQRDKVRLVAAGFLLLGLVVATVSGVVSPAGHDPSRQIYRDAKQPFHT